MLFNSLNYIIFLPTAVVIYWLTPRHLRYPVLLVFSYVFYASWIPIYLILLLGLTAINYCFGLLLARQRHKSLLALAVSLDLGVLAYFKYANFGINSARALGLDFPTANILLPLGISFFVFEFIHYIVDVFRGNPPVRNIVHFALFVAFFPTQIAGPIKRYQAFVHQLLEFPKFNLVLAENGVHLILRGLFKKMVLADAFALLANQVFNGPSTLNSSDTWLAVYAFALQIFFDFSGYTDIGRGSAQLLGFIVPENFEAPYLSRNPAVFWRRWHISLSTWLRDYLFIPLGGSRTGQLSTYRNLFLTMTLGGLWHGAAWHFVAWGAYQGLALAGLRAVGDWKRSRTTSSSIVLESTRQPSHWQCARETLGAILATVLTFHVTCLGWVLFRAENLSIAASMYRKMLWPAGGTSIFSGASYVIVLLVLIGYATLVWGIQELRSRPTLLPILSQLQHVGWLLRPIYYVMLIIGIMVFQAAAQRFVYFQF